MIVIVGGGMSGLALGRELAARGADFMVLEASARVGGVIRSARVEGRLLDWGPQRARLTRSMSELIGSVGLTDQVVTAPPGLGLFVYRRGRLRRVPFSVGAFLASDVVGPAAKARVMLEPLTAGPDPDESVARFFTRKLGRELYETLVGPLYGGLYGSDPADMVVGLSLGHVLREFGVGRSLVAKLLAVGGRIAPPPACSFRDGMQALPDALAASLGGRVRTGAPVEALARAGAGWEVVVAGEAIPASEVVIAVPAPDTARLLAPLAPEAARRVGSLRYNPLGVVHLHAETALEGMGFQVSFAEPLALRGVTYNDSLFGRDGVYTAYLGGGVRPEAARLEDAALARLAVDEFRLCTGYDSRPIAVAREEMPAWDRSWSALAGLELPNGVHLTTNWESRPGLPGRLARARALADQLAGPAPADGRRSRASPTPEEPMIRGVHTMFYSDDAAGLRAFLRDKLGLPAHDVGEGWLIFQLPEADMGVHPTDPDDAGGPPSGTPDISFYCDDVRATVAELEAKGVEFTHPVEDHGYGLVTHFRAPGGLELQLYEPRYGRG